MAKDEKQQQEALNKAMVAPKVSSGGAATPTDDVPEGVPARVNPERDTLMVSIPTAQLDENGNYIVLDFPADAVVAVPREFVDLEDADGVRYFIRESE